MYSVTKRISMTKQPRGGYINKKELTITQLIASGAKGVGVRSGAERERSRRNAGGVKRLARSGDLPEGGSPS